MTGTSSRCPLCLTVAYFPQQYFALTLQVAALAEGLDVSDLVEGSVVPPAGGGQVSAAWSMHDDEHGPSQNPQPAQPEDHQQCPSDADPAEGTEPGSS